MIDPGSISPGSASASVSWESGSCGVVEKVVHIRRNRRIDADHFDRRLEAFERQRDPGDQPAAADRDDHALDGGQRIDDLQPNRALPGDHQSDDYKRKYRSALRRARYAVPRARFRRISSLKRIACAP